MRGNVLLSQANDFHAGCSEVQGCSPLQESMLYCIVVALVTQHSVHHIQTAGLLYQALAGPMARDMMTTQGLLVRLPASSRSILPARLI